MSNLYKTIKEYKKTSEFVEISISDFNSKEFRYYEFKLYFMYLIYFVYSIHLINFIWLGLKI